MSVAKVNVALRRNPPSGDIFFFNAGDTLPDWVDESYIGSHITAGFGDDPKPTPPPKDGYPDVPEPEPEPEEPLEAPALGAHFTQWRKYGEALGLEFPAGTSRDEMQLMIWEEFPDMMPADYVPPEPEEGDPEEVEPEPEPEEPVDPDEE